MHRDSPEPDIAAPWGRQRFARRRIIAPPLSGARSATGSAIKSAGASITAFELADISDTAAPVAGAPPTATGALLRRLAPWLAALAISYPMLIWPLFEAPPEPAIGNFAPAVADAPSGILNRVFFPVLLGLSLAALWLGTSWREPGTWRRLGLAHPSIVLLAVAIGWAGCTSFWAVEPDISFRRFFLQVFISASLVGAILAARKPERVMHATFWTMVPVAALNAVAVVTEPPGPIGHEGIYPHKNYFGGVAVVLMMFAVWRLGAGPGIGRVAAIALAVLSVWFIVVSESKTSLALIVVAPTAALGLALVQRWLSISPLIAFTAALVIATFVYAFGVAALLWDFESAAERIFGDPTLTQRTDIWAFALKKIPERPWLGFGYEVFWGAGLDSPSLREGPGFVAKMPHAHNGYIDAVLQTGIVGLITLVAVIGAALATAGRVARRDLSLGLFVLSVFVMSVLYNGLETTWLRSFNMIWMLFVFALALSVSIVSEPPGGTRRSP